jgi:hypothetical protein
MITITAYEPAFESDWDAFVKGSRNGIFMLQRPYMDYHGDRFEDASIVARDGDKILGLLPAHRVGDEIHSHRGLTFGGFIIQAAMTMPRMQAIFQALLAFLGTRGISKLNYAPIPHIYHRYPSEEDLYVLFELGAVLRQRQVLSVIDMSARLPWQTRRRRGVKRAAKMGLTVQQSEDWAAYWRLLGAQLEQRYNSTPVHTLDEITMLQRKFPSNIKLHTCRKTGGEIEAGIVIYESKQVARTQYIASSDHGRQIGAVDFLFSNLLDGIYAGKPFFDFGSSNGTDGNGLAAGLLAQKEGFGARTIVQDLYQLEIA